MADRMLEKVAKLLNQAENAATPEEAEAFMEKVQVLASANAIDLAVARAHQADKTKRETPEKRTVKIRDGWKERPLDKWLIELYLAIARTNDIECLIGGANYAVYPYGMPSDLDYAEALFTSVSVQMVQAADAAVKRGDHKERRRTWKQVREDIPDDERAWGDYVNPESYSSEKTYASTQEDHDHAVDRWGQNYADSYYPLPPKTRLVPYRDEHGQKVAEWKMVSAVDARVFRQSFYEGYIARLSSRLWEAKRKAQKEAGVDLTDASNETGVVLRSKALEVKEFLAVEVGDRKLGTYKEPESKDYTGLGENAGREAAANASLGLEHAMGASRRAAIGSDR